MSILEAATPAARPLTCAQFIRGSAYPKGGMLCPDECLVAEIKANRYPAPTGLGLLCAPGTCDPAVQSRYRGTAKASELGLASLECPCNWFGSDCPDDWVQITAVLRKERLGDFETTVFAVSAEGWRKVMAQHRPGGVVRCQAPSASAWGDRPLEAAWALANDAETGVVGELEVLTGPPEEHYHRTVTELSFRVRALPVGPIADGKGPMYINPSVSGFFNKQYIFLLDALAADATVEHVVMIATGTGLSGVRTAIAKLLRDRPMSIRNLTVHLYYGLRDARHLPYRTLLASWASGGGLEMTVAISSKDQAANEADEPGLAAAIERGAALKRLAKSEALHTEGGKALQAALPSGKLYAQHLLGLDLAAGPLARRGATLANSAVVICGRVELLLDAEAILGMACEGRATAGCGELMKQRVFMNI